MGSTIARSFITSHYQGQIFVYNRTLEKARALQAAFPDRIVLCPDNLCVARSSEIIFLAVKADDAGDILRTLTPYMHADQILLYTISAMPIAEVESIVPCKAVKLIPSITHFSKAGALPIVFGTRITDADRVNISDRLCAIGIPHPIAEKSIRIYADLTSCSPAFLADWLQQFTLAAQEKGVDRKTAEFLLGQMVYGVGKLLIEENLSLEDIIRRVAVPGGVTTAGLDAIHQSAQGMLQKALDATEARQNHIAQYGHA